MFIKLILALFAAASLLPQPPAAHATLAYSTNVSHPHVWVAKNDEGKGAKEIGVGWNPKVSPDGELVVFERLAKKGSEMELYDVATGKTKTIFTPWRDSFAFAWSPDSTKVAALRGGETGERTLCVVHVRTGKATKIATGYFNGISFSSDSTEVVFGMAVGEISSLKSDIFRAPVSGGTVTPLTHDHNSGWPLWGPTGSIVFVKLEAKQRQVGPKNELFLMDADGKGVKQLTHTEVDPLSHGLTPIAWSASGKQLLTEYVGRGISYGVAVDPKTGAERSLSPGNTETGFVGVALSANGKTVLGYTGGSQGAGARTKIASVPYAGGKPKILVRGGFSPSWGG